MAGKKTASRQRHGGPQWSLDPLLAALPLALIVVGPALVIGVDDKTLRIYACQIATAVLVIHLGFGALGQRAHVRAPASVGSGNAGWLLAGVALLAVPLMNAIEPEAGLVAYLNFASGTVGGIAIAQVWRRTPHVYSWIDVGYLVLLVAGTVQLLVPILGASSVNALHQSTETPWGNSSLASGALVVTALIVMARSTHMGRFRKLAITIGLVAIGVALLTLTRGSIIGASVGAVFFLWSKVDQRPRRSEDTTPRGGRLAATTSRHVDPSVLGRLLLRALAVVVPVVGYLIVERATELRAQLGERVHLNVDTRLALYRLAWEHFLESPLTGTGWASFRGASLDTVGENQTFAHNLVFSMLQIGGLMSFPYLVALAVLMYRAFRHGGPYAAAIAAAIAISMTQPFFESTVCNLIVLPVAILAGLPTKTASSDPVGLPPTRLAELARREYSSLGKTG